MIETLELVDLENLLDDEPGCEFGHHQLPCSGPVTHRLIWCRGTLNICANAAERVVVCRADLKNKCADCGSSVHECWRLNPA